MTLSTKKELISLRTKMVGQLMMITKKPELSLLTGTKIRNAMMTMAQKKILKAILIS